MDLKQAFLQKSRGRNASNHDFNITFNTSCKLPSQSDEGNNSSSSNNHSSSTHTEESNRVGAGEGNILGSPSPVASPLLPDLLHDSHANNITSSISSMTNLGHGHKLWPREFEAPDPARLLNLACMHEPPSPSSSTLETQVLLNLNGSRFNNSTSAANNINSSIYNGAPAGHHGLSVYLSSSSHGSPTYVRSTTTTCSLLNGGSPHSKFYPHATHWEEPVRGHHPTFLLPSAPPPQAPLFSSASRIDYASLPSFNSEPAAIGFTPRQLLEFTQQTYIFKHFVAGVTPPPTLLLPIINSVASMRRIVDGSRHFSGLLSAGGLRGNIDPEPGRCRRTDGKKWRCSREAVVDQKYCERHMHRGRHRARANKLANGGTDMQSTSTSGPSNAATSTSIVHSSNGVSTSHTVTVVSSARKEPHFDFSLQPAPAASMHLNRSSISNANDSNHKQAILLSSSSSSDGILKRLHESNHAIGMSLAVPPETPPNLVELLKANPSAKSSLTCNPIPKAQEINTPFSFFCQTSERDADNSALRQLVDGDDWPIIGRDDTPSLSWFEPQNYKRGRYNTELSISTTNNWPLTNLSAKFGGCQQEELDLAGATEASTGIVAKLEDLENYSGRSVWVPIAWESPALGGPLGEVLQSNAANFGGSLAKNGGARCLNLIEEESWVGHVSGPAKDSHSPNLASPTGVLQRKASYSDSSSSASSPRASALKLDDSANLGIS